MTETDITDWTVFANTLYLGPPGAYVAFPGDASGAHVVATAYNELLERHRQLQAQIDGLNLAATQYSESRDRWFLAARQAEAQAALLRDALLYIRQGAERARANWWHAAATAALDSTDAGAALLAELEAARAAVEAAEAHYALLFEDSAEIMEADERLRAAFAAYHAARKAREG